MGKQTTTPEFKKEELTLKEFVIERVKFYEAVWDTTNPNYMKANIVTNCWLNILQEVKDEFGEELLERHNADNVKKIRDGIWQGLRGQYRRHKKKTVGKSGDGAADVVQVYNFPNIDCLEQ
jgi:hypothetical protein